VLVAINADGAPFTASLGGLNVCAKNMFTDETRTLNNALALAPYSAAYWEIVSG
jgi:hypothetical protein